MSFNTIQYALFLPLVWLIYCGTPDSWRWLLLLCASFFFYAAVKAPYLLGVLCLITGLNYCAGMLLEKEFSAVKRKALFWGGVLSNLGVLVLLKYLPFFLKSIAPVLHVFSPKIIVQPVTTFASVGVSFYVFQAISYLSDVYLRKELPEKHFGYFALSLGFFPKLLQGPIERAGALLPQLRKRYIFDYQTVRLGLLTIAGGLFKKMVLADRLALYVDPVYNNVSAYSGAVYILATYMYALQLYFDFSAYTDIAIGSARLFNIELSPNFNRPYLATSISDFWRRWHISLSTWFRDYLYIPLGGNRVGSVRRSCNLMIVFLLCGLWHGAGWTFIVWGGLHGLYLVAGGLYRPAGERIHRAFGVSGTRLLRIWQAAVTFHLVCFAWIFFRANTIADAFYIFRHMFSGYKGAGAWLRLQGTGELLVLCIFLSMTAALLLLKNRVNPYDYLFGRPLWFRWSLYIGMVLNLIVFGVVASSQKFAYFKF